MTMKCSSRSKPIRQQRFWIGGSARLVDYALKLTQKSGATFPTVIGVLRIAIFGDCRFPAIDAENRMIVWKNAVSAFTIVFLLVIQTV
jgi:hypothetical protein